VTLLSGRYQLGEVIGEGVSAKVYRATDTGTGSQVAIKLLSPHLGTDPISIERFRREIQITRFIGHPQIVSIYDLIAEGDRVYLVMEYLRGSDLKQFIAVNDPVEIDVALDLLGQMLRVLAVCHAKNVVHRDLKPQNVMVSDDRRVTLLDFGISRMTALSDLTQTGSSLGSPEYMAPELFSSNTYDPRTDIYALGVILFELITGRLPFDGDSLPVLCRQHLEAPVPAMAARRSDVPAWLQELVERMLAKDAHHRYQTVDELQWDLERRTVTSRRLPSLEKRECLACASSTIAEVPFCLSCGRDHGGGLARGVHDVWCAGVDAASLHAFLAAVLGPDAPAARAGAGRGATLIAAAVDSDSAELLRRGALRHGIVLTVRRRSIFALAKKIFALLGFGVATVNGLLAVVRSLTPFDADLVLPGGMIMSRSMLPPHLDFLFTVIRAVGFCAFAWFCFAVLRREMARPLLHDAAALERRVGAHHDWLRELVAVSMRNRRDSMRSLLPLMIEKYVLLVQRGASDIDGRLRRVLRGAAEIAAVASEFEARLEAAEPERLTTAYAALGDQLEASGGGDGRTALDRRRRVLASQLEDVCALEDAHAALLAKLIHFHSLFNRLLGKVITERLPLDQADAELLDASLRTLGDDVSVARQVRADMARVA